MKNLATVVLGFTMFGAAGAMADVGAKEYSLEYSGQELVTYEGVVELHERILHTAKQHCPSFSVVRSVRRVQTCVSEVADDLVAKVDHPQLTSYHHGDGELRVAAVAAAEGDNS
jgi:UrcA family protein